MEGFSSLRAGKHLLKHANTHNERRYRQCEQMVDSNINIRNTAEQNRPDIKTAATRHFQSNSFSSFIIFLFLQEQQPTFSSGVKLPLVPADLAPSGRLRPSRAPKIQIHVHSHDLAKTQ